MAFLFIILLITTILLAFFTYSNYQRYGTFAVPLMITGVLLIGTVAAGLRTPFAVQQVQKKDAADKRRDEALDKMTDADKQRLQNSARNFGGSNILDDDMGGMQAGAVANRLTSQFSKMGAHVTFNNDTHTFEIRFDSKGDMHDGVQYIEANPSKADDAGWSKLTKNIADLSEQLSSAFAPGYNLSIMGVDDSKKTLYTAKDGETTYDFTK